MHLVIGVATGHDGSDPTIELDDCRPVRLIDDPHPNPELARSKDVRQCAGTVQVQVHTKLVREVLERERLVLPPAIL